MAWWKRKTPPIGGSILLRGNIAPRAENYEGLRAKGIDVAPLEAKSGTHWRLQLTHPSWGRAELASFRQPSRPPAALIDMEPRMSAEDRQAAKAAGSTVDLMFLPASDGILRERKHLLRFLHAISTSSTVAVLDHTAQAIWSPTDVEDELVHDADLDIQWLFTIHAVTGAGRKAVWAHTHGFRELGFSDFDILDPSEDVWGSGYDIVRALAYAVVEEKLAPGGPPLVLVHPGGNVQLVATDAMLERGKNLPSEWRGMLDDDHRKGHAVVCEPMKKLLGFLPGRPVPSAFLSSPLPEEGMIYFSSSSTALMAERAKGTWSLFRSLVDEFQGLGLPMAAKLGYTIDGGGPNDREHLWFEVHSCDEREIDATLANRPFHIARMKQGQRGRHPADRLSDWMIMTPLGSITPRRLRPAREVRLRKDEIRAKLTSPRPS